LAQSNKSRTGGRHYLRSVYEETYRNEETLAANGDARLCGRVATIAPARPCPATAALEAQQHALNAELNAMTDKCSPAWFAGANRSIALARQINSTGGNCHTVKDSLSRNLSIIASRKQQCAAAAAEKQQQTAVKPPPVQSAPRDPRNIPTPQTQHGTPPSQPRDARNIPTPQTQHGTSPQNVASNAPIPGPAAPGTPRQPGESGYIPTPQTLLGNPSQNVPPTSGASPTGPAVQTTQPQQKNDRSGSSSSGTGGSTAANPRALPRRPRGTTSATGSPRTPRA